MFIRNIKQKKRANKKSNTTVKARSLLQDLKKKGLVNKDGKKIKI